MAAQKDNMVGLFQDLGIAEFDWVNDPNGFALLLVEEANKLRKQLQQRNTITDVEERFRYDAVHNSDAVEIAEEFINRFSNELYNFTPEVMVNILARMPVITQELHGIVRATAMRKGQLFSRRRLHGMYIRIRKMYESYTAFYKSFDPDTMKGVPLIPALPGNYSDDSSLGITEYVFYIGTTQFYNYYNCARILGIQIASYMDLVEYFEKNSEFDGKPLRMVELTR
jgi:hypothetical protein